LRIHLVNIRGFILCAHWLSERGRLELQTHTGGSVMLEEIVKWTRFDHLCSIGCRVDTK
jgi:hypothetical protein